MDLKRYVPLILIALAGASFLVMFKAKK